MRFPRRLQWVLTLAATEATVSTPGSHNPVNSVTLRANHSTPASEFRDQKQSTLCSPPQTPLALSHPVRLRPPPFLVSVGAEEKKERTQDSRTHPLVLSLPTPFYYGAYE
ncbi:hypothetical protein B296_00019206 [Ensete ventricosum]|uniref:Secreted protein n=1 Tax=Ensete ventricosum TaxID=4639 RepID=A0A427AZP0_ENSVE|nr:hypothetical protein B296_00019206 [Ensete ventricosum]